MNDIEVQTEEIEEPAPNPAEEDLIRLQSSMCEIQEDFTRERQMLKDQIAHLQVQLYFRVNACKTRCSKNVDVMRIRMSFVIADNLNFKSRGKSGK